QIRRLESRLRLLPRQVPLARVTERDRKIVRGGRHADISLRAWLLRKRSLHRLAESERGLGEVALSLGLDPQRPELVEVFAGNLGTEILFVPLLLDDGVEELDERGEPDLVDARKDLEPREGRKGLPPLHPEEIGFVDALAAICRERLDTPQR